MPSTALSATLNSEHLPSGSPDGPARLHPHLRELPTGPMGASDGETPDRRTRHSSVGVSPLSSSAQRVREVQNPRASNHGGHNSTPTPQERRLDSSIGARFDWYEATFDDADDDRVAPALALSLGGEVSRGKGRNGYATCSVVERAGTVLAQVYGRSARSGEVHVTTTSESCDEVVPVLRRLWPDHRVSRADSAVDFAADFDALDVIVLAFARDHGLSHRLITNSEGGATRYLGSPSSEVQVRVYKKSEQLLALHPESAADIVPGIVRFELVARPGKRDVKESAGTMHPDALWGLSKWSKELALVVLNLDAERVSTHFRRPTDWGRAMHYLGIQYGPMVERRAELVGIDRAREELLAALGLGNE